MTLQKEMVPLKTWSTSQRLKILLTAMLLLATWYLEQPRLHGKAMESRLCGSDGEFQWDPALSTAAWLLEVSSSGMSYCWGAAGKVVGMSSGCQAGKQPSYWKSGKALRKLMEAHFWRAPAEKHEDVPGGFTH